LQLLNCIAVLRSRADRMHDVDTGVAVIEATVAVCGDFEAVRVTNFHQFMLDSVLIIDNQVPLYNFIIAHVNDIATLLYIGVMNCSISKKFTTVLVSGLLDQSFEALCKGFVCTE